MRQWAGTVSKTSSLFWSICTLFKVFKYFIQLPLSSVISSSTTTTTTSRRKTKWIKENGEKMYLSIFQGGNYFVNLLSLLRLGSTFFFGMLSFLQCIFLAFSIRELRGWGLELFLVVIAIYRLRILLEGRWRVYCREQRQAGGLMAPYPANFSIIWSNSPTNLI